MEATLTAEFEASPAAPESVVRRGLLFRAGSYPDKEFSLTPEEMADEKANGKRPAGVAD